MKSIFSLVAVALLMNSYSVKADDMDILVQSLCDFAKTDNRSQLRKKIKQSKLQLNNVYGGITCGADGDFAGGSLLKMATFHGALDAAKYIGSQIGSSAVSSPESDGVTILDWSKALIAKDPSKAASVQPIIDYYEGKE